MIIDHVQDGKEWDDDDVQNGKERDDDDVQNGKEMMMSKMAKMANLSITILLLLCKAGRRLR